MYKREEKNGISLRWFYCFEICYRFLHVYLLLVVENCGCVAFRPMWMSMDVHHPFTLSVYFCLLSSHSTNDLSILISFYAMLYRLSFVVDAPHFLLLSLLLSPPFPWSCTLNDWKDMKMFQTNPMSS